MPAHDDDTRSMVRREAAHAAQEAMQQEKTRSNAEIRVTEGERILSHLSTAYGRLQESNDRLSDDMRGLTKNGVAVLLRLERGDGRMQRIEDKLDAHISVTKERIDQIENGKPSGKHKQSDTTESHAVEKKRGDRVSLAGVVKLIGAITVLIGTVLAHQQIAKHYYPQQDPAPVAKDKQP